MEAKVRKLLLKWSVELLEYLSDGVTKRWGDDDMA